MPTIEVRPTPEGKPVYRVKIRLKEFPPQSETFARLTDAKRWAQSTEAAIREGRHLKNAAARKHTVGELIDKYVAEVLPTKPRNATLPYHSPTAKLITASYASRKYQPPLFRHPGSGVPGASELHSAVALELCQVRAGRCSPTQGCRNEASRGR